MDLERKYIIKPNESLIAGTHTYVAVRLSDWKKIEALEKHLIKQNDILMNKIIKAQGNLTFN